MGDHLHETDSHGGLLGNYLPSIPDSLFPIQFPVPARRFRSTEFLYPYRK